MTAPEKHLCQGCQPMKTGMESAGADLALQPKSTPIFPLPAQHAKVQCGFLTTCPGYCEPPGTQGTSSSDLPRSPLVSFYATLPILPPPLLGTHSQTGSLVPASFSLVSTPPTQTPLALLTFQLKIFCLFEGPCQLLLSLTSEGASPSALFYLSSVSHSSLISPSAVLDPVSNRHHSTRGFLANQETSMR